MADLSWIRTVQTSLAYGPHHQLVASIPAGSVLRRVRFSWGFNGFSSQRTHIINILNNVQVFGLVTTVGDGSETPPNPRTDSANANPPAERWLWWEARAPKVATYSGTDDAVWYTDSLGGEPTDEHGQVSARSIPAGSSVNLWASWAPAYAWDVGGQVQLWFFASVGYE